MAAAGSSGGSGFNEEIKLQQYGPWGSGSALHQNYNKNNHNSGNRKNGINFE